MGFFDESKSGKFTPQKYSKADHKVLPKRFQGIISDMPNEVYHSQDSISNSGLKEAGKGGEFYQAMKLNGSSESDAKLLGSLFHDKILMPESFLARHYATHPKYTGTGSVAKNKAFTVEAKEAGLEIVTPDMMTHVSNMREAVMQNPVAKKLVENSLHERSHFYTKTISDVEVLDEAGNVAEHEDVDLSVRFRPDIELPDYGVIADLKKVGQISKRELQKAIFEYGYYMQDPFYSDGYGHTVTEATEFYFIYVQDVAPYACIVRSLDEDSLALGQKHYENNMRKYAEYKRNNSWFSETETLGVPEWVLREF